VKSISPELLASAIDMEDGEESARRVKYLVAEALAGADRTADVFLTRFFNHSYIPDMVLEWPKRGTNVRREVYLRPSGEPLRLQNDVIEHETDHPLFLRFSSFGGARREDVTSLGESARSTRSLVTEVGAIGQLGVGPSLTSELLPPAVLRSGVGLLEQEEATTVANVIGSGFSGALNADRASTASALEVISSVLDTSAANEMSTFLETMWMASGSRPEDFPGPSHDLSGPMPAGRLQALIDAISDEQAEFWRRIGRSVDFDSFAGLHLVDEQPVLQILIPAALPNLSAHACRVLPAVKEGSSPKSAAGFSWQVDRGLICLSGAGRQAWVGLRNDDLPRPRVQAEDDEVGPSPSVLAARARLGSVSVRQVELVGNGKVLTYRPEAHSDEIAYDELSSTFHVALGTSPKVTEAAALVGSKYLDIDFQGSIASGRTNARFSVASLLWSTCVMLGDYEEVELEALRATLRPVEEPASIGEPEVMEDSDIDDIKSRGLGIHELAESDSESGDVTEVEDPGLG